MATQLAANQVQGTERRNDGMYRYYFQYSTHWHCTFHIIVITYLSFHFTLCVQTMENRFQILLDCKNDHIDMLLRDLEDAEEQNLKQYGAHAEIVSQFLSKLQYS